MYSPWIGLVLSERMSLSRQRCQRSTKDRNVDVKATPGKIGAIGEYEQFDT